MQLQPSFQIYQSKSPKSTAFPRCCDSNIFDVFVIYCCWELYPPASHIPLIEFDAPPVRTTLLKINHQSLLHFLVLILLQTQFHFEEITWTISTSKITPLVVEQEPDCSAIPPPAESQSPKSTAFPSFAIVI